MDFTEVVTGGRMVRNFSREPAAPESLRRILDAARRGPSAGFSQGQDLIVVAEDSQKQAIAGHNAHSV